jgi:hypothetical protein
MRLIVAFLIAPLTCSIVILLISMFNKGTGGLWLFSFVTIIAYVVTFVIGLPVYLLLKKYKKTSLTSFLSAGSAISILPIGYFIVIPFFGSQITKETGAGLLPQAIQVVIIFIACLLTAILFWVIARPDRVK